MSGKALAAGDFRQTGTLPLRTSATSSFTNSPRPLRVFLRRTLRFKNGLSTKCVEMQTFHAKAQSSQRRRVFCALHALRSLRLCVKPLRERPVPTRKVENQKRINDPQTPLPPIGPTTHNPSSVSSASSAPTNSARRSSSSAAMRPGSSGSTIAYLPSHQRKKSTRRQRSLQKGNELPSRAASPTSGRSQIGHCGGLIMMCCHSSAED